MSPVATAINTVNRAIGSFHPAAMPRLSRAHYRREILAWTLLPIMIGAVEGGVVSVIAKNMFAGQVPNGWLNASVAVLAGAPTFANVTSFLWAALSHGRDKIRFLVVLQLLAVLLVAQAAFAPRDGVGLAMIILATVGARVCWSGVVTLRSTVWGANYPRPVLARMAGKLATAQALMLGVVSLVFGLSMRANEMSYHALFPLAAGFGLVGALVYGRMRMRGHAALLNDERRQSEGRSAVLRPLHVLDALRSDRMFRRYMITMFVFGTGNLMMTAPVVIMMHDRFGFGYLGGMLIISSIPILLMPLALPLWSRLLDRVHIVRFRMYHVWAFIAANLAVLAAAMLDTPALLWPAAALKGVAFAGGVLGWNLGHHDFAPPELASQYMGVHVTLTGIRGLFAPALAVAIYVSLEAWRPDAGGGVFALCLFLNLLGAVGFARLNRKIERNAAATATPA
ncbi:MAG: MFS transporter [Planctomycetes bacterium]|nr:MFS transporter [Planctomycetota bacterium]